MLIISSSISSARSLLSCALVMMTSALHAQAPKAVTLPDLLAVQRAVQQVLPSVQSALVSLESATGAASGVIVSSDGLILTAAHVATEQRPEAKPGRKLHAFLANGTKTMARTLGFDLTTDAAMLQLEGSKKDWPFVPLQQSGSTMHPGDWCFALGHPGGRDEARGSVLRMGKVLKVAPNSLQTDCVLMGGDSGGPLFNLKGELIGIHSQIWEDRDQNVHVSLAPYLRSWDAMKNSEVVRVWERGAGGWLGVATREINDGSLEVDVVAKGSPAQRAGLHSGDKLVSLDKSPLSSAEAFSNAIKARAAGDSVVLEVRNRNGLRIVTVKLAQQPES